MNYISNLPWTKNIFGLGVFCLGVSVFGLCVNLAQIPPSYTDLSDSSGYLGKIDPWNINVRYSHNSGTDIYIDTTSTMLRLNMGQCEMALNSLSVGDNIAVKYQTKPFAAPDGFVYEVYKGETMLCSFSESIKTSQKIYNEWWYVILISPILGMGMIVYALKT